MATAVQQLGQLRAQHPMPSHTQHTAQLVIDGDVMATYNAYPRCYHHRPSGTVTSPDDVVQTPIFD